MIDGPRTDVIVLMCAPLVEGPLTQGKVSDSNIADIAALTW